MNLKRISCRVMAFDATEEELIADELRAVIPGCEVLKVHGAGQGQWLAEVRKCGQRGIVTETIKTQIIDDTYLGIEVLGYEPALERH